MLKNKNLLFLVMILIFMTQILRITSGEKGRMITFYENKNLDEIIAILKTGDKPGFLYFGGST